MTSFRRSSALFIPVMFFLASSAHPAIVNMAPTIDDFGDVVIGDAEQGVGNNVFVFPDVVNLDTIANDDMTSSGLLIWTYASPGGVYLINGATPVDPGGDDLVNPPAAKRVDTQKDPLDTTGARTITLRDNLRSPIGEAGGVGPYSNRNGSTSSTVSAVIDSRVVTLYVSDGTTVALANGRSFIVYTLDNGYDRISAPSWTPPIPSPSGWLFADQSAQGKATGAYMPTRGMCITVGATGDNDGAWTSPYGIVTLVADSAWEMRATVTTSQTNVYQTPLWMLAYDNAGGSGADTGHNEYGGEIFFLDNVGGANSPIAGVGRGDFRFWMMPTPMQTPQFSSPTTGFFSPVMDSGNDMRLAFRVLDIGSASYGAGLDSGSVCLGGLTVIRHSLADMVVDATVMAVDHFSNGRLDKPLTANSFSVSANPAGQGATALFTGTSLVISPTTDWSKDSLIECMPGDTSVVLLLPGTYEDDYPIPWVSDTLYYIEYMLSAPTQYDEINPPDVIRIGADTLTAEICTDHFVIPNTPDLSDGFTSASYRGLVMPRYGAPQKYGCFFYTHSKSATTIVDGARWRPRFEILNGRMLLPMGRTTNLGGVQINGMSVKKVHFAK